MTGKTMTRKSELPRTAEGEFQHTIEDSENDAIAARLRMRGMTYREIAVEVGVSVGTAYQRVQRALRAAPAEAGAELRQLESQRLDMLWGEALAQLVATHPYVDHGRIISGVEDMRPKLAAIRELRMLSESRRRLLGLDAPQSVHVSVSDEMTRQIEELAVELGLVEGVESKAIEA